MADINQSNQSQQQPDPNDILVNEFILAVSNLLLPNEFKGTALYGFLIGFKRRWNIFHVDLDEVIVEAVKRGIEYIRKHDEPIRKPEAWLRPVCLNILRHKVDVMVKDERKSEMMTVLAQPSKDPLMESEFIEQLEYLDLALNRLSREDQEIIRMKFIHRKTYDQIRHHYKLMAEDAQVPSVQALRKRESRALKRLRAIFLNIYEGDTTSSV
jgi:RNA polymerase sigma factor (sigma-70 family)